MKKLLFSVIFLSLSSAYASNCPSIENDIARLACYDKAVEKTKSEETDGSQQEIDELKEKFSDWIVDISESPLDDSKEVSVMRVPNDYETRRGTTALIIRCKRNTTDAYVTWGEYLGSDNMKVSYRIDKENPKSVWWNAAVDGRASFIPKPISFIKSLEGKESIYIEAEKYRGDRVSATFDISGIEEVIKPLREACNW